MTSPYRTPSPPPRIPGKRWGVTRWVRLAYRIQYTRDVGMGSPCLPRWHQPRETSAHGPARVRRVSTHIFDELGPTCLMGLLGALLYFFGLGVVVLMSSVAWRSQ